METEATTCSACLADGYSPSAAVMLRPGLVQCPDCDGFGTPHRAGLCACPDEDASDHECDISCPRCGGDGRVECEHAKDKFGPRVAVIASHEDMLGV